MVAPSSHAVTSAASGLRLCLTDAIVPPPCVLTATPVCGRRSGPVCGLDDGRYASRRRPA
jgi:hypothetical protein